MKKKSGTKKKAITKNAPRARSSQKSSKQRLLTDSVKRPPKKSAGTKKSNSKASVPAPASISADKLLATGGTLTEDLRVVKFAGVALGGGKTDKTAVAVLDFYPDRKRVFLRSLRDKVSMKGDVSADEMLYRVLTEEEVGLSLVAFDVPLQLPMCLRCPLACPGVEACPQPPVIWMREIHKARAKTKRPNKMFTPYTERAAEIYIANHLEEPFHPSHALGANAAPLTARAQFLLRRLGSLQAVEVYPRLSLWRIGTDLSIPKSHLRFHRHAIDSDEARLFILKKLIEKEIAFIYQQDLRTMVENDIAFEAFICALTAFLKYRGQTEKRPAGFPSDEIWIDFPRQKIQWF